MDMDQSDDRPAPVAPATAETDAGDAMASGETESLLAAHPMLAVGAALAIGAGIGLLLPRARAATAMGVAAGKAGASLGTTAKSAISAFAALDTARSLFSALSNAGAAVGENVRTGARDLAAQLPDKDDLKAQAREAGRHIAKAVDHAKDRLGRH